MCQTCYQLTFEDLYNLERVLTEARQYSQTTPMTSEEYLESLVTEAKLNIPTIGMLDKEPEVYLQDIEKGAPLLKKSIPFIKNAVSKDDRDGLYDITAKAPFPIPLRLNRAENATLVSYKYDPVRGAKYNTNGQNAYEMVGFKVKSEEETEEITGGHTGYVVYKKSDRNIRETFCTCADFFFRLYAPYVKAGIATFQLDSYYQRALSNKGPIVFKNGNLYTDKKTGKPFLWKHNKEWTVETNPEGRLFLCKHLARALADILNVTDFKKVKLQYTGIVDKRLKDAERKKAEAERKELLAKIQKDIQQQKLDQENKLKAKKEKELQAKKDLEAKKATKPIAKTPQEFKKNVLKANPVKPTTNKPAKPTTAQDLKKTVVGNLKALEKKPVEPVTKPTPPTKPVTKPVAKTPEDLKKSVMSNMGNIVKNAKLEKPIAAKESVEIITPADKFKKIYYS